MFSMFQMILTFPNWPWDTLGQNILSQGAFVITDESLSRDKVIQMHTFPWNFSGIITISGLQSLLLPGMPDCNSINFQPQQFDTDSTILWKVGAQ
jgi:hypothetical protein